MREFGLLSLRKRSLQKYLIATFQYLKEVCKKAGWGLFTRACTDRTGGNGFKLKEGTFRLPNIKKFFILRHWNGLCRDILFKARLDGATRNLVLMEGIPAHSWGLEPDDL